MGKDDYRYLSHWRVLGTAAEVADILADLGQLSRWWPSVCLDVEVLERGARDGVGTVVSLQTRGWIPYTMTWQLGIVESRQPYGFSVEAWGDLVGTGRWAFVESGPWVDLTLDWTIHADRPLLRQLSFLLRPIFASNFRWAMTRGERSLQLELVRRRATTEEALSRVPSPPGPSWSCSPGDEPRKARTESEW